ncbi:MAG: hypothetical protein IPK17_38665 [Chloroflexi bacterium]|uniref:hypothetical protein n=1 Tax=Candidatus Flexifilum breve TaxID=3140694 RepID=UPI003134CF6D|nr:hypothetical protein [Chloroflexota bacterium]
MIGSEGAASDGDPPPERMMNALDLFLLLIRHYDGLRRFVGLVIVSVFFSFLFLSPGFRIAA